MVGCNTRGTCDEEHHCIPVSEHPTSDPSIQVHHPPRTLSLRIDATSWVIGSAHVVMYHVRNNVTHEMRNLLISTIQVEHSLRDID